MSALRISSHSLEIEWGRYCNKKNEFIPREERFCTLCEIVGLKNLGDEKHAMICCPKFESDRAQLIKNISEKHPGFLHLDDFEKMIFMLKCVDECATYVGKFIYTILSTSRPQIVKDRR